MDGFTDVDLFEAGSEEVFLPLPTDLEIHEINYQDNRVQTISPQTLDSLMSEVNTTEYLQPESASTEVVSTPTPTNFNTQNLLFQIID